MDKIVTYLSAVKGKSLFSNSKRISRLLKLFAVAFALLPMLTFAEGTDELCADDDNETYLFFCNDFADQCDGGNGARTQFAIYGCDEDERLYFSIENTSETVYFGFNWEDYFTDFDSGKFRIKSESGALIWAETIITDFGEGYIDNVAEARAGPIELGATGGYDAYEITGLSAGKYYIEFDAEEIGNPGQTGNFLIKYLDVTIYSGIDAEVKTGRLFSKGWQFLEDNSFVSGWDVNSSTFFVYSTDSIVTSLSLNEMEGRAWLMFCNSYGMDSTLNFEQSRKSIFEDQVYTPEYNIFLNNPDTLIFPPAQILGSITDTVIGYTDCNNGIVDFVFTVDKAGNVEVMIDLDPPYVDVTITEDVHAGMDTIQWDGFDGSVPPIEVPNNVAFNFTLTYINGLTNLPLYDVEGNPNGFAVELVSPASGSQPLLFWDDLNIPIGTTNLIGCTSTVTPFLGCHDWNDSDYGDLNTINTWWYSSSQSTSPVHLVHERKPGALSFVQPSAPPTFCAGEQGVFVSVLVDLNTDKYNWNYTGNDFTIIQADSTQPTILINFGPQATSGNIQVWGTNENCLETGDTSLIAVSIAALPQPQIGISPNDTVCINSLTSFSGSDLSGETINSWSWNFGDGNGATTQNTTHTYDAILTDSVMLIAVTDNGCTDTIYQNIEVTDPTIGFTFSPQPACIGDTIFFTGTGDIVDYTDWIWDFGDGNAEQGRDVWNLYTGPDTYNVNLTVCSKNDLQQVTLNPQAIAIVGNNDTICQGDPYDFSLAPVIPDSISCDSIKWLTSGIGSFDNDKLINPIYFTDASEIGDVTLSLIAYGVLPCGNDTSTMVLTVDSVPTGFFSFAPDTVCVNGLVNFNAGSTSNIVDWSWEFGDGNLGNGQNISHSYIIGDTTFDVGLTLLNSYGCSLTIELSTSLEDSIFVDSVFTDFSISNPAMCFEDEVTFTGTGDDITFTTWDWDFGDGSPGVSGRNQSYTYSAPGTYDVKLIVCTDTTIKQVTVNTLPQSVFSISPNDTSCMGEQISFNATDITGDISSWVWEFGDGNVATGQDTLHAYSTAGNFSIKSIYTNSNGCIDTTTRVRNIQDVNVGMSVTQSPTCENFLVNIQGTGDLVTFTPWLWTFGDGTPGATGQSTSHIYTVAPDTVDIILDVCSEQEVQQLIINAPCEVDAGSDEATCEDVYFELANSTTPPTAGDFASLTWTHDGQGSFDDPTIIHPTYFPGINEGSVQIDTVTLTLIGEGIAPCPNDTSTMQILVVPGAYAQAGSDENGCFGVPFDFANSTDSSFATNYVTLNWSTSGTGSFVDPSVTRPIYIPGPGEIGPVTLTMVASNIINCDSIDEMILTIRPIYEVPVDFTVCFYDSVFAQGQWRYVSGTYFDTLMSQYNCDSVIITNLTVRPKIDKDFTLNTNDSICRLETVNFTSIGSANLTSWSWDFGDGNTSTDLNPVHQYDTTGNFTIVYHYTDDNGCSDSATRNVRVFDLPDVSFTIIMTDACVNTVVTFQGNSNSNISLWEWDFDDGNTGLGQNTSHQYTTWGNMYPTLTVTDINGCSQFATDEIKIAEPPVADFSYSPVVCDSMQFTDLSTSPAGYNLVQWFWDFGDGVGTSTLQNPSYQYPSNTTPGGEVFMVTLTVVADSNGFICSDSIVLPVTVPSLPDIFYTFTPDPTCLGDTTFFYGESGFPIDVWQWDFDDGNFSNDQDATHIFTSTGDYDVVLTITDTNLCQNTLVNTVRVNDIPTVSFTVSDSVSCHGNQIGFISTVSSNVETWFWDFDDGSFSNDQNPVHYFPQGGNYNVSLTVTDSAGCSATFTDDVLILPGPTADFSYQNITCSSVLFTDLSTAPTGYTVTEWLWDFGDGFTSNIQNPSHSYTLGIGTYDVTLIVTADSSNYSCQDTIVQTIYTPGLPSVFFTWTPEPTMLGDLTSFFGTSGNTIIDWYWDFGDGNFATTQDATHTFATVGSFTVELTVTDIDGCQNSVIHQVTVTSIPELDFSWNYSCEGSPVQFTVLDPPTDLPAVVSFSWDFGDGGISDQQDPEHVYVTSGTYNVSLTIIDTMAATNTVVKQITVNPLPISLFSIGSQTCQGNDVSFTDYSTTQTGYITEWFWDFGDGNTQTVIFPNSGDVTHQYAATGNYVVTLTITNSDSCSNSSQNSVTILPSPTAMFTNTEGCQSTPIDFTDQSTQNGGGSIISWAWDFDDPGSGSDNTSTLQNPTHLFSSSGSFDVLLVVENINGCIDSITMSVTVEANPEVDFTWDNACVDADVEFTSDYTGGDATYSWTFGDGGTSNLPNPTYSYTTPGDYTVTLTITTTLGCVASSSHTVEIHPLPNANFAHTGPACLNQEVEFTNLSTSPNGTIDTWVWDFGDGTTVTINAPASPDVTHLYANDGTFDVVLTVTDVEGCESSVTKQVIVVNSPIADFTYDESCYNEPVIFTDISTTNSGTDIQSWYWDFGDPASGTNNTSNLQNPSHVFTSPGTYTTTLIIVSTFGCSDTTTKDVEVEELPFAEIGMLDDSICLGELAEFTGTGSDISTWYWEFGDGGTSIEQNPSYMYAQTGIYIVSLTVTGTGTDQCTYTTDTTITVNDAPQADFSYENTCLGDSTYFTDLSYSQYGFISEWLWDFGDGSTSTLEDPSHVYLTNDDFQVTLIVTDNFGCSDTLSQWIQVFGSPIPSFSWDQVCDPVGQVNFFDQSTPGLDNSPIVGWEWHLDDGYFSTEIDPSYIYSIIDTCYTVTLTVTDNNGCYSTDTNTQVCLHGELEVDFTTDVVCENQSTLFTATYSPGSDSVASYSWNFNDGTPIVSTYYDTITHIFPNAGMYIVELTALDTNDCVATIYKEVMVDSLPTAQFTYDQGSCENPTEFTDISLGGGEFIQSWYWDFGDLTSSDNTSTLQNPTHMYPPNDSTYIVKLVITNFNGCMDSIEQQVFVDPCLIAGFVIPDTACARYEMCFRDTSSVASSTSQVSEWRWDFGDGTTYNYTTYDEYVCHTFSQAGDYPVELVILANIGGTTYSDTVTKMVRVNPTPVAIMDYTNGCFGDTTMFYDASASYGAPIIYYHWDLGDPNTSVDTSLMQDTMYVYPDYGTYYPELIVQNEFTCSDTIGDTITIYKLPTAEFSFEEQCMSYYTYFTDESTNDSSSISSWYWDFGHGTFPGDTSIDQDPVFIYDTTGVYTTSLIVTDANGCIDSTSRDIDIWPIPQTNFVVIDTNQQGQIYLDNLSQGGVDYYWDFDYDYGVSTTEKSPIHQYEVDGSYDIMLVSYNEYNCPDTMHQIYDLLFRNLFVPNAFIPSSSDQELRTFLPKGINLRSYTIEIYSSWGNRVFESTELNDGTPAEGWDGTYKDEPLPTGSYIWRISAVFEDGEYWKGTDNGDGNTGTSGTITLIR